MPLTLTLTEGVIPAGKEKEAVVKITDAFLKHHGLTENKVMRPNITSHVIVLPKSSTFSGGEEFSGAWIEWKVPSFAFNTREIQQGFFTEATEIIHEMCSRCNFFCIHTELLNDDVFDTFINCCHLSTPPVITYQSIAI